MKRILLVLVLCLAGTAAFAAVHWTNVAASSGDFNLAANWENATLPTASDKVDWFGYTGLHQYSVTLNLSGNAAIHSWEQDYWANSVDVNLNGYSLTGLSGMWSVMAYGGTLGTTNRIYGGGTLGVWQVLVGTSGSIATSPLFEIYGAGTVVTTMTGMASFGNNTRAFIRDGAKLITGGDGWATATIGQGASSSTDPMNAVVTLNASTWENNGILVVGYVKGNGLLSVTNGSAFTGYNNVNLGGWQYLYNPLADHKASGTVRVTGAGSKFETTGRVDAGLITTGKVEVLNGGYFKSGQVILGKGYSDWQAGNISTYGGTNVNAYGVLSVSGVGSTATVQRLTTGFAGTGLIEAKDKGVIETYTFGINLTNGTMTVDDAYIRSQTVMNTGGNNTYNFVLRNKDANEYYLDVGTALTLNGTDNIYIDLSNFSGVTGQYRLINYGTLSGSFDNEAFGDVVVDSGAYAGTTLENNTGDGYVYLNVIPEPASVLLLASGILAAYKLRRRA